jgi:Na+/proline symporter
MMDLNTKTFFVVFVQFLLGCVVGIFFVIIKLLYSSMGSLDSVMNTSLTQAMPPAIFVLSCGILSAIWGIDVIKALFEALKSSSN